MNGYQQEGFGAMDMTVTCRPQRITKIWGVERDRRVRPDGTRASTWKCYLKPLMHPNSAEARQFF